MSYESRQKKRRHKRIEAKARRRSPQSANQWFLTVAKQAGKFTCCGGGFERGAEIVYRHEPKELRCLRCADRDPECSYRPSIRWERKKRVPRAAPREAR
jgi:hypothetical protein